MFCIFFCVNVLLNEMLAVKIVTEKFVFLRFFSEYLQN